MMMWFVQEKQEMIRARNTNVAGKQMNRTKRMNKL